jgi:hypothetical protein
MTSFFEEMWHGELEGAKRVDNASPVLLSMSQYENNTFSFFGNTGNSRFQKKEKGKQKQELQVSGVNYN